MIIWSITEKFPRNVHGGWWKAIIGDPEDIAHIYRILHCNHFIIIDRVALKLVNLKKKGFFKLTSFSEAGR